MTTYASGADLIARYDADMIGDYCQDSRSTLDRDSIATHPNVVAALEDACGEIDSAMLTGGKYTAAQLAGLTGNARSHLKRITCAIAMSLLMQRRGRIDDRQGEAIAKEARDHIKALREGTNIFGLESIIDAGLISLDSVSTVQIEQLNLLPGRTNYFPGIQQRMPYGR